VFSRLCGKSGFEGFYQKDFAREFLKILDVRKFLIIRRGGGGRSVGGKKPHYLEGGFGWSAWSALKS